MLQSSIQKSSLCPPPAPSRTTCAQIRRITRRGPLHPAVILSQQRDAHLGPFLAESIHPLRFIPSLIKFRYITLFQWLFLPLLDFHRNDTSRGRQKRVAIAKNLRLKLQAGIRVRDQIYMTSAGVSVSPLRPHALANFTPFSLASMPSSPPYDKRCATSALFPSPPPLPLS